MRHLSVPFEGERRVLWVQCAMVHILAIRRGQGRRAYATLRAKARELDVFGLRSKTWRCCGDQQ